MRVGITLLVFSLQEVINVGNVKKCNPFTCRWKVHSSFYSFIFLHVLTRLQYARVTEKGLSGRLGSQTN